MPGFLCRQVLKGKLIPRGDRGLAAFAKHSLWCRALGLGQRCSARGSAACRRLGCCNHSGRGQPVTTTAAVQLQAFSCWPCRGWGQLPSLQAAEHHLQHNFQQRYSRSGGAIPREGEARAKAGLNDEHEGDMWEVHCRESRSDSASLYTRGRPPRPVD